MKMFLKKKNARSLKQAKLKVDEDELSENGAKHKDAA